MSRFLWTLVLTATSYGAVQAQLKDVDFKVPSAPAEFSEKAVFVDPAGPPVVKPGTPLWGGGVEFGLNGTDGNTEVLKIRLGANVKRQTEGNIFTADLVYGLARQMGITSEHKALFNARDEVYFNGSAWGLFASTQVEYDEFRAFDFRVAAHAGVAYQFIRTDATSLRGRVGAGASREIGGEQDEWVPEGLIGFDLYHKVGARQRLVVTADYYPDLAEASQFRVRAQAAYECALDDKGCLTLRIGVQDRYDSKPGNARRNDVDYFTTLLYKF